MFIDTSVDNLFRDNKKQENLPVDLDRAIFVLLQRTGRLFVKGREIKRVFQVFRTAYLVPEGKVSVTRRLC